MAVEVAEMPAPTPPRHQQKGPNPGEGRMSLDVSR